MAKRIYVAPKLVVYGTVKELTRENSGGSSFDSYVDAKPGDPVGNVFS